MSNQQRPDNATDADHSLVTTPPPNVTPPTSNVNFISGLISGTCCAAGLHWWDRALYLSVLNKVPFLTAANFMHPHQGLSQTILQRSILGSVYYTMQGELKNHLEPYLKNNLQLSDNTSQLYIGLTAGAIYGMSINSFSAIKYYTWGEKSRSFISSINQMWEKGGIQPFVKGTKATVSRDMVFGSTYEVLRNIMNKVIKKPNDHTHETTKPADPSLVNRYLITNTAAAGIATVLSAPFNYARTIQYAADPAIKSPSIAHALQSVWQESLKPVNQQHGQLRFLQQRFRIGWGSARAATGMALGQMVFDYTKQKLSK